jgi:hypothetical protein
MRGNAHSELVGISHGTVTYKQFLGGEYEGEMGVFIDASGNVSEGMLMPNSEQARQGLYHAIDDCAGPVMKEKGIFKKREVPIACPALGGLAIANPEVRQGVQARMALEAYSVASRQRRA